MEWFSKQRQSHARINAPALVQVAAIAIISTRCLDLFMLFNMLGVRGVSDFVHRSVQTWSLTLVFLASLLLLCIEFRCAFVIMKGRNWGRWIYMVSQIIAAGYLGAASLGFGYPELFSIAGETPREIFTSLIMQKLPDILVVLLLFMPEESRRFFRLQ
ncbi:YbjO family protein [Siccibacter turicensis]|uniref:YbjO family protein n=1 Tax=Siccibacter turicensis TaxID=357233 RepID=UPI00046372FA|nr:YbjO family protein [Siccibacter turicensis]